MARIESPRPTVYRVKKKDTLKSIATSNGVSLKALLHQNCGTTDDRTVQCWLFEQVGARFLFSPLSKKRPAAKKTAGRPTPTTHWKDHLFDGKEKSYGGSGNIAIPPPWLAEGLKMDDAHELIVTLSRPAPIVSIDQLDKWFIPGTEDDGGDPCQLQISNFGDKRRCQHVATEIYGSNYCEAAPNPGGVPPVTLKKLSPAPLYWQRSDQYPGGKRVSDLEWDGQVKSTEGMLKRTEKKTNYVNVGFSPYTVVARLCRYPSETKARIDLADFWPQWTGRGKKERPVGASLKVGWTISGSSNLLKHGNLQIVDCRDQQVFAKALASADLSDGSHRYTWNGEDLGGKPIKAKFAPYRIQIQARSELLSERSLGLAAMQTEVRLFVHPSANQFSGSGDPLNTNSLEFQLEIAKVKKPLETDSVRWGKYQLAKAGLSPGFLSSELDAACKPALLAFQSQFPQMPKAAAKRFKPPYKPLSPSGTFDAETLFALKFVKPDWRPLFGDKDSRDGVALETAAPLLKDNFESLILWVESRYPFSKNNAIATNLPLQIAIPLRPRDTGKMKGLLSTDLELNKATQVATALLRINIALADLPQDLSVIDTNHASYKKNKHRIRSKKYVELSVKRYSDKQGLRAYSNCPSSLNAAATLGGHRDFTGGKTRVVDYLLKSFELQALNKEIWELEEDLAHKTLFTYSYGDVGQTTVRQHALGKGECLFSPSKIAGDGYQLHAALDFANDSKHPNAKSLAKRYPFPPKAYSAALRLWKRATVRGQVVWCSGAVNTLNVMADTGAAHFEAAHIAFLRDGGPKADNTGTENYGVGQLLNAADFAKIARRVIKDRNLRGNTPKFDSKFIWPYDDCLHMGFPESKLIAHAKWRPTITAAMNAEKVRRVTSRQQERVTRNYLLKTISPIFRKTLYALTWQFDRSFGKALAQKDGKFCGNVVNSIRPCGSIHILGCYCKACKYLQLTVEKTELSEAAVAVRNCVKGGGCNGKMKRWFSTPSEIPWGGHMWSAGKGSVFINQLSTSPDTLAHEIGHERTLEHSNGWHRGGKTPPSPEPAQHDSMVRPGQQGKPVYEKDWAVDCVMAYNTDGYFCGKCLLKLRGWTVSEKVGTRRVRGRDVAKYAAVLPDPPSNKRD